MNRTELQTLALVRARDAEALLAAGQWSGAYYLAGYAVECGLKACIALLTREFEFPARESVLRSYTHKLETLVDVARLKNERDGELRSNPAFTRNWNTAASWTEESRYALWSEAEARIMVEAIADVRDGVLTWIMAHW